MASKTTNKYQTIELISRHETAGSSVDCDLSRTDALGVPRRSRRVWTADLVSIAICVLCFLVAMVAVFNTSIAGRLGQVNQLITLGFMLQIMAICAQSHLRHFYLSVECLWSKSSLRNYESILRMSVFSKGTSILLRIAILLYLALPLVLGIAYKGFTGGEATWSRSTDQGMFGWTGPPGTEDIGTTGVGLFYLAVSPWWNKISGWNGTYGFNLVVESDGKSALLDGPSDYYIDKLRGYLKMNDSMQLTAIVNSTACELVFDNTGWEDIDNATVLFQRPMQYPMNMTALSQNSSRALTDYAEWYRMNKQGGMSWSIRSGSNCSIIVPENETGDISNSSVIITSRWNTTAGDTFGKNAQGFYCYYKQYKADWQVSQSGVVLSNAVPLNKLPAPMLPNGGGPVPNTIENNNLDMQEMYLSPFVDLDWKYLGGDFNQSFDHDDWSSAVPQQAQIHTDTTLVTAMVWSRLTSRAGMANPYYDLYLDGVDTSELTSYMAETSYTITTPALKRSGLLAFVLAINPFILLGTLIIRVLFLNEAPISRDFGLIAFLAGIEKDSLDIVKGAAYSGELKRDLRLVFTASADPDSGHVSAENSADFKAEGHGLITTRLVDLDRKSVREDSKNDRVARHVMYS